MKEHPILFSTPMVQAILEGRKNTTRRVVKHQDCVEFDKEGAIYVHHPKCLSYCEFDCNGVGFGESPYGLKGNHLWLRETFQIVPPNMIFYKADSENKAKTKWKPSIFMPRIASRITLEITNVRVERLQEITDEDALKEGIEDDQKGSPSAKFYTLWKIINGKKYPWSSNPWCWVIEFKGI